MTVLEDAPAVKVTGTLTNWGMVLTDWNKSVAAETPLSRPGEEATSLTVDGPIPDSGNTTSQLVIWLAGNTDIVRCCPAGTCTSTLVVADWSLPELLTDSATEFLEVESLPALPAGPWKGTASVALIWLPAVSVPSTS